jgi:hypothetical protein
MTRLSYRTLHEWRLATSEQDHPCAGAHFPIKACKKAAWYHSQLQPYRRDRQKQQLNIVQHEHIIGILLQHTCPSSWLCEEEHRQNRKFLNK